VFKSYTALLCIYEHLRLNLRLVCFLSLPTVDCKVTVLLQAFFTLNFVTDYISGSRINSCGLIDTAAESLANPMRNGYLSGGRIFQIVPVNARARELGNIVAYGPRRTRYLSDCQYGSRKNILCLKFSCIALLYSCVSLH